VDYGFRLLQAGYRNIYCPQAELYHYEGKSRGYSDNPVEVVAYRKIYSQWKDRYYNPNLSLENEGFEPAATRPETRRLGPVTVVLVSHNLNQEGAPAVLLDLAVGLVKRGVMAATVLSPADGPLRAAYEAAGIPVRLIPDVSHAITEEQFIEKREHLGKLMLSLGAEVVLANTLSTFWAVSAAEGVGLSSVWCQHESEDSPAYF